MSSTVPPPMVMTGENMRTIKRSPGQELERLAQSEADVGSERRAGSAFGGSERADGGFHLGGAGMEVDRSAILERLRGGQQFETCNRWCGSGVKRPASASSMPRARSAGSMPARLRAVR